jgi:uncharacterized phage-associated protein
LSLLNKFIIKSNDGNYILPKVDFNNDEFSNNDIELMDLVVDKFGFLSANELISYTHRGNSPWYNTAKENAVLYLLENEVITNTEYLIDMGQIVVHDKRKSEIYRDYFRN